MTDKPAFVSITIPHCFVGSTHEAGFCIDRPQGNEVYVFALFHSPVTTRDCGGRRFFANHGAILYAPGFPQWYSSGAVMYHSWFHADGPGMPENIARYSIPTNQAMSLIDFPHLDPFLRDLRQQQMLREMFWEEAVSLRAKAFLLELGRAAAPRQGAMPTRSQAQMQEMLRHVRAIVHADLARLWPVPEMSQIAHLSASRFSALYSSLFGVSPLEDLIESRLRQARSLLAQTTYPIEQIAEMCGFASPAHFSRVFRVRIGCSPSRYRWAPLPEAQDKLLPQDRNHQWPKSWGPSPETSFSGSV